MSQPMPPSYPPSYQPQYGFWPQYLTPPEELLAPARRAGILLIVTGVLAILLSGCGGLLIASAPDNAMEDALRQQQQMNPDAPTFSVQFMKNVMYVMAGIGGLIGIVALILGVVVRGGSMVASVLALIFAAICGLGLLLLTLSTLANGIAAFVLGLAFMALPLILCAATIWMLIQAIRAAPKIEQARQQLLYYQQQQQMAYYQQAQQPPQ